ncbi:MAG: hypothetical protein Q8O72_01325 [Bacteroidales bacterium]|nr:hypothetical protein [Bacteroidales bacterium]
MRKHISMTVECPHCLSSLMDENVPLSGHPSVKLNIVSPEDRGTINLCSVYECFDHVSTLDIKDGEIVDFYCPHCNKELLINEECKLCGAPMVSFVLRVGGRVTICSRKGCSNHYVAFNDLATELAKFYEHYGD